MTCCCSVGTYDIQLKFYAFFDFFRAYWLTISNKNVDFAEFQLTNQLEQFFFSVCVLSLLFFSHSNSSFLNLHLL